MQEISNIVKLCFQIVGFLFNPEYFKLKTQRLVDNLYFNVNFRLNSWKFYDFVLKFKKPERNLISNFFFVQDKHK